MRLLLHFPLWGNRWIPYVTKELSKYDLLVTHTQSGEELGRLSEGADLLMSMWCNAATAFWTEYFPEKHIVTYLRRYEIWENMADINFDAVDALIFVSPYYQKIFNTFSTRRGSPKHQYVIMNGVDINHFPYTADRNRSKKIGIVGSIKHVKNLPLAGQIALELNGSHTIHHVGIEFSDQHTGQVCSYFNNLGLNDKFFFEPFVNPNDMHSWYSDKAIILSTSLNEGNPNCIIEAMAMGIKPVIHNWPGAKDQFPKDLIFDRVGEAVEMIQSGHHEPERYRQWIIDKYSVNNFKKLHVVIGDVLNGDNSKHHPSIG